MAKQPMKQVVPRMVTIDSFKQEAIGSCQGCSRDNTDAYIYRILLLKQVEIRLCRACLDEFRLAMRLELSRTS